MEEYYCPAGRFVAQFVQKLPVFPSCPQFGQVQFSSGLFVAQFVQKLPVFPSCPQFGQVQFSSGRFAAQFVQKLPVFPACPQSGHVHSLLPETAGGICVTVSVALPSSDPSCVGS